MSRRDILRVGGSASALIAGGALVSGLAGCSAKPEAATGFKALRQADVALLRPWVPAIIGGAIKSDDDALRCLALLDQIMFDAGEHVRATLYQLYDLLQMGLARWYFTGQWGAPADLSAEQLEQGLAHWISKDNSFSRVAFRGLTQPMLMAWFANTQNSLATGYPGPPKKVVS